LFAWYLDFTIGCIALNCCGKKWQELMWEKMAKGGSEPPSHPTNFTAMFGNIWQGGRIQSSSLIEPATKFNDERPTVENYGGSLYQKAVIEKRMSKFREIVGDNG
jgi:hypothetical protein